MTDPKRKKAKGEDSQDADVMHGRDFAGTQFAADENEQTRDIERAVSGANEFRDDSEFVTDAEIESR